MAAKVSLHFSSYDYTNRYAQCIWASVLPFLLAAPIKVLKIHINMKLNVFWQYPFYVFWPRKSTLCIVKRLDRTSVNNKIVNIQRDSLSIREYSVELMLNVCKYLDMYIRGHVLIVRVNVGTFMLSKRT